MGNWYNTSFQSKWQHGDKRQYRNGQQRKRRTSVKAMKDKWENTKDFILLATRHGIRNEIEIVHSLYFCCKYCKPEELI